MCTSVYLWIRQGVYVCACGLGRVCMSVFVDQAGCVCLCLWIRHGVYICVSVD